MEQCCAPEAQDRSVVGLCPSCNEEGQQVSIATVGAMVKLDVEPVRLADTEYRLCRNPACETIYFGLQGATLLKGDLRVRVGFKEKSGEILLCYCFDVTEADLRAEIKETGSSASRERIIADVKMGRCACTVKNPTGRCCLGDLAKVIKSIREEIE